MATEKLRPSFTFTEDRLAELQAVVPEAFADGKLDWDTLREALGNYLDDDTPAAEHFGLNWPGKREARRLAAKPSHGTLRPALGEGINEETTGNLFIEGDNLEVLKLLQKSYAGRVKMIYIDPPYNTGNDFVYKDDFSEPLESYLRRSGQSGEAGELLTSNPKSSGRFHTNWLNMIYPRLRLARTLLRDDGAIFVSIDDNEVHHLRAVMNEVFGEENFLACIANVSNPKGRSDDKYIAPAHEYVLVYKPGELSKFRGWNPEQNILRRYNKVDSDGIKYREIDLRKTGDNDRREDRQNLFYYFHYNQTTKDLYATRDQNAPEGYVSIKPLRADGKEGNWRWEMNNANANLQRLIPKLMPTRQTWSVFEKDVLSEDKRVKPTTAWTQKEVNSERGSEQFIALGFDKEVFPRPKPVGLIKMMLHLATEPENEDIILDFFAGSASAAHAILELNREDCGNRRFVLVQIPEATPSDSEARRAGYITIAEIGKERIRRVVAQIQKQPLLEMRDKPEDLGFKILKLAPSHFKAWNDYEGKDLASLQSLFDEQETPLVDEWTLDGLLAEVLLLEGFPLDSKIKASPDFTENAVQSVSSPACDHRLWVCFDSTVQPATLEALTLPPGDVFVCLDSALDDNAKLRLTQAGSLKTI